MNTVTIYGTPATSSSAYQLFASYTFPVTTRIKGMVISYTHACLAVGGWYQGEILCVSGTNLSPAASGQGNVLWHHRSQLFEPAAGAVSGTGKDQGIVWIPLDLKIPVQTTIGLVRFTPAETQMGGIVTVYYA